MRQYDIIVGFNGTTVEDGSHFLKLLSEAEIGSTATMTVLREGRRRTVRVTIEQAGGRTRV
jgi:S1-C subfamily serine protease